MNEGIVSLFNGVFWITALSLSASLAFQKEKKREAANPDDLPYTWGYFWGYVCMFSIIFFSFLVFIFLYYEDNKEFKIDDPVSFMLSLFPPMILLFILAYRTTLRKRWSFLITSIAIYSPITAINFFYIGKRWAGLKAEAKAAKNGVIEAKNQNLTAQKDLGELPDTKS